MFNGHGLAEGVAEEAPSPGSLPEMLQEGLTHPAADPHDGLWLTPPLPPCSTVSPEKGLSPQCGGNRNSDQEEQSGSGGEPRMGKPDNWV